MKPQPKLVMTNQKCPLCNGHGGYEDDFDTSFYQSCFKCLGTGRVLIPAPKQEPSA